MPLLCSLLKKSTFVRLLWRSQLGTREVVGHTHVVESEVLDQNSLVNLNVCMMGVNLEHDDLAKERKRPKGENNYLKIRKQRDDLA